MAIPGLNPEWMDQNSGGNPVTKVDWIEKKALDIAYGSESEKQRLDIYWPDEEAESYPVLLNVHGGGFTHCDKRDFHLYPTLFARPRGYAVVAVNYRLSPEVRYPEHIHDVLKALEWISHEGKTYRLDSQNVFLWGISAGGNIVLHIGCQKPAHPRHDDCVIRGVAALCPAFSLTLKDSYGSLAERMMCWGLKRFMTKNAFGTRHPSPEALHEADVANYVVGGIAPLYLQHGTEDPAIAYSAAVRFAELVRDILPERDFVFDTLQGAAHVGAGREFFLQENVDPILDFFDRHLEGSEV